MAHLASVALTKWYPQGTVPLEKPLARTLTVYELHIFPGV